MTRALRVASLSKVAHNTAPRTGASKQRHADRSSSSSANRKERCTRSQAETLVRLRSWPAISATALLLLLPMALLLPLLLTTTVNGQ